MPGPPLVEWLRSRDDAALAALLRARPDLAVPPPADSAVLATRAGIRASVARACEDLDRFTLTVLTALVVAGADVAPVTRLDVARLLGRGVPAARTRTALDGLRTRALAWGSDDAVSVTPAVREVTGLHPAGLGRRVPELDGVDLDAALAGLADAERAVLAALAEGPPVGATRDAAEVVTPERARTPVQRLLALGLLRRVDAGTVELPLQVGLALRGDRPLGPVELDEPPLPVAEHGGAAVDATAAGAVLELLRHTEELLAAWSADPPAVLRAGGLGVREVRRTARALDVDEARAVLLVEVAAEAGLLTATDAAEPQWIPTAAVDGWLAARPEQRWAALATAWLELPRLPALAGTRDERDRPLAPLAEDLRRPLAPVQRRRVLEALAELAAGAGVRDADDLAAVLAWRAPRRGGRQRDEVVAWTVQEATALGLVALDALTGPGRALLDGGPADAGSALAAALPEPVDHVLVQADRTVVAPGPLAPELAAEMALVADVESAGGATVYRVTEQSVRRALDAGRSAAELHELFRTRSRTPVPQTLTYLVDDVARRHGRLRGGAAASFLRCDDEAVLTELLAHPVAARCELRRLAPTVLVSPVPLAELLDEVRGGGFAPAAEGPDGQVLDLRPRPRRAPVRPRAPRRPALPPQPSAEQLDALVRTLRDGDAVSSASTAGRRAGPAATGSSTGATVALLQSAATAGTSVRIGFVDSHGIASRRIVRPVTVGGGVLEGVDRTGGGVQRFPLHRITSAAPVAD